MLDNKIFLDCVVDGGSIVSMVITSAEGRSQIANSWNKYIIVDGNKILMPCLVFRNTEENLKHDLYTEVIIGSDKVKEK